MVANNNIIRFDTKIAGGFRIRNARKKFACCVCKKMFVPSDNTLVLRFDYLSDDTSGLSSRHTMCLVCAHSTLAEALAQLAAARDDPDSFTLLQSL